MSDTAETLAKIRGRLARVRSSLENFDNELSECNRWALFRGWPQRIRILSDSVGSLALQVDCLADCIESICNVLEQDDSSEPG